MLTSRKGLITNLNYVHLQQGSLGGHLPLRSELGLKEVSGRLHQWKDTANVVLVDANSNDPSVPCQCCEQSSGHREALVCEEYQSPDELPLSPPSPSSPSTDSSSSSDFTLDDSPVSMCYREYEQEELRTPERQPDIIPLDVAPDLQEPISSSQQDSAGPALEEPGDPPAPEHNNNNAVLDSNCNTLPVSQKPRPPPSRHAEAPPQGEELLSGFPGAPDPSHQSPRKSITSFQQLAQKRRKSDWLIIFSPDTEQPPANELTDSAFYHGTPPSLPEGKGVTTFRELRYRNTLNKQSAQQVRAHKGPPESANGAPPQQKAEPPTPPPRLRSKRGLQRATQVNTPPAITGQQHLPAGTSTMRGGAPEEAGPRPQRMADGAEGKEAEPLMAAGGEDSVLRGKKALLIAIGSAVDRIIAHFNGSRKQVQKAQLGDSRLNPSLGYLIAEGLCPALAALLGDGLKPFQKDVIIGRRRLGPWNLVEASAKTGPEPLHLLFCTITRLQPLRDPQRRFNAFIFSLLNAKQLEAWLSHLHLSYAELSVFFLPSGFLPLAATSLPELREELLLTLQPLSALTFHTDLLFEHHHLPLQDPPTPQHPPPQSPLLAESWGVPAFQHILDLGGWLAHNLTGETPSQSESCPHSQHDGGARGPSEPPTRDCSTTWWGHLTQASRMYLPTKRERVTSLCKMPSRGDPEPLPRGSEEAPPLTAGPSPQQKAGWFGPLFGESSGHSRESEGQNAGKSRRPSSWLPPNVSVLHLIRRRPAAEERAIPQPEAETARRPERMLRALCDHSASGEAQLSFRKDDVLQLLGRLDDDWIHCRHGNNSGLVPVGYTSLIL